MNEKIDQTDHASKGKGLAWLAGTCVIGVMFAYGLAPVAHAIPWSWEKKLSHTLDGNIDVCHGNAQARAALEKLVTRLYPLQDGDDKFSLNVKISKSKTVNAFAMLGGEITINDGLLKQARSAEEVAGVLAHEIEHVRHRHIMQGVLIQLLTVEGLRVIFGGTPTADWTGKFLNMNFTRTQEAQADREGLKRLQAAHIDNTGFHDFFERMEENRLDTFISDHPTRESRADMVLKYPNENTKPVMSAGEWISLKSYCR